MNMTLDVRRQAMKSVLFPFTFGLSARAGRTLLLGSLALFAGAGCDPADPSSDSPGSDDAQPAAAAQAGPARVIERLSALRGEPVVAASKTTGVRADIGSAAEGVHLRDEASGAGVRVRVAGASAAGGEGEEVDGAVVYPGAGPGGSDLVMVPTASGVEDWVLLEKAPARASIGYALALEDVAGLRLVAGVLELLDASGAPRLRARAPYLVDSAGARHAARFELVDCKADTSAAAPWGRSVTAPGRDTCHLEVTWKGANVAYPAALDPVWEATTGSLAKGRRSHTATQLGADTASPVLLAGGFDGSSAVAVAELYQPKSRTFAATGTLSTARGAHAAVQLQDGRVVVAGGAGSVNATATGDDTSGEVGSLEVYSPITGLWSAGAGTLTPPRANLTATLLGSGKVLLAGGQDNLGQPLKATAIYDPSLPSLDNGGPQLAAARSGHTATAIDANRVLIVGGFANVDANSLNSTEIYSATTGAITAGPAMIFSRAYHSATVIAGNKILLAGGISKPNDPANAKIHETTEIYTPGAGAGTLAQGPSMTKERAYHAAARLATGFVVVSGGFGGDTVAGSTRAPPRERPLRPDAQQVHRRPRHGHRAPLPHAHLGEPGRLRRRRRGPRRRGGHRGRRHRRPGRERPCAHQRGAPPPPPRRHLLHRSGVRLRPLLRRRLLQRGVRQRVRLVRRVPQAERRRERHVRPLEGGRRSGQAARRRPRPRHPVRRQRGELLHVRWRREQVDLLRRELQRKHV
ncbi:MAG: kelch repeat-containing protein [Polyangiaceae bacterium]